MNFREKEAIVRKKPTVLKMRDNVRVKNVPATEPKPVLVLPKAPKHLSHSAQLVWRRMGKKLLSLGLITEVDEASFAIFCSAYADLQKAEKDAQTEELTYESDKGNTLPNPFFYLLYKLRAQVYKYGAIFGMSPSDRSGISVQTRDEANPYRAWQQGRVANGGKKKKQKTSQAK
jgi:P27 family predicted phage terminase small subunit